VLLDARSVSEGRDPQLERAVQEALRLLDAQGTRPIAMDPRYAQGYLARAMLRMERDRRQLGGPESMPHFRGANLMGMARAKLALGDTLGAGEDATAALEIVTEADDRQTVEDFLAGLDRP
jgi:hypothetical protein